jgi:hypothetical protein
MKTVSVPYFSPVFVLARNVYRLYTVCLSTSTTPVSDAGNPQLTGLFYTATAALQPAFPAGGTHQQGSPALFHDANIKATAVPIATTDS